MDHDDTTTIPGTETDAETGTTPRADAQEHPGAREAAQDVAKDAQARAREVGRTVTEQTKEAAKELRDSAAHSFSNSKGQLAKQIEGLAKAFRKSSDTLRDEEMDDFARFSDGAAAQLEDLSSHLGDRGTDELLGDLQRVARERPVLFMGSLLTIGVLSARFLRSSQPSSGGRSRSYDDDFKYEGYERGRR